jgi:hypothetical protein
MDHPPPAEVVSELACRLRLTLDEANALLTDFERAPGIMAEVRERFQLSDDYDGDGPEGLQLFERGVLSECAAQWLDGVA